MSCLCRDCFQNISKSQINADNNIIVELELDEESNRFIDNCKLQQSKTLSRYWIQFKRFALSKAGQCLTDINGMLNTGKMFLFSRDHVRILISEQINIEKYNLMLDVGCGNGLISAQFSEQIDELHAVEVSKSMIKRLDNFEQYSHKLKRVKSFLTYDISEIKEIMETKYDLIGLLNIIDRCTHPLSLIKTVQSKCKNDNSYCIIALVFPFSQWVSNTINPTEYLAINQNDTVNEQVNSFLRILKKIGFDVLKISKLPQLSEGNSLKEYFMLKDFIFVLK